MKTDSHFHVRMICLLISCWLAGCAVGPDYVRPDIRMPTAWQAPVPHGGKMEIMDDWWSQFKDPVLTELQKAAQNDSPTLDKAVAAIRSARASVTSSRAVGIPSLSASATAKRFLDSDKRSSAATITSSGLDASWEIGWLNCREYWMNACTSPREI